MGSEMCIRDRSVGMLKRSHDAPRLILNKAYAYTTDTAYRIESKVPTEKLVYCFLNSLTALSAELEGRHYGGGVLELVPSEIERLLIPLPSNVTVALSDLDAMVRSEPMAVVLQRQDRKVLSSLGLSVKELRELHEAWNRLRNRRQRITGESTAAVDD